MTRSLRYLAPDFSSTLDADLRPSPGSLPGTIPLRPSQGVLLTLPAAIVRTHRWAGHWGSRVGREGKRCVEVAYLVSSQTQQDLEARGPGSPDASNGSSRVLRAAAWTSCMREDFRRVRQANAMQRLGSIRRLNVSLTNVAMNRARCSQPRRKLDARSIQKRFRSQRGGPRRLQAPV